ncbi:single hybrid motif-containing protein [Auriculariales sp. MPI-PUGE-AT-0066]|nr:single hybrid motif-containing protein [Auriculariales sp. MPI-PUGE-AT-0066]
MTTLAARMAVRALHSSVAARAATRFAMPAMSPTMTEGGITRWSKQEGESFAAGDILLEIETDKATIDVEAQDDGVLAKILTPDGTKNIAVGQTIAVLAEPGDDLASLDIPKEEPAPSKPQPPKQESKPASSPPPQKSAAQSSTSTPASSSSSSSTAGPANKTAFPSVQRLLHSHGISSGDAGRIKGTGMRGMLTKGDVLAHLGLASSPTGTYREPPRELPGFGQQQQAKKLEPPKVFDGPTVRRLIAEGLSKIAKPAALTARVDASFDSILADYSKSSVANAFPSAVLPVPPTPAKSASFLDGLL